MSARLHIKEALVGSRGDAHYKERRLERNESPHRGLSDGTLQTVGSQTFKDIVMNIVMSYKDSLCEEACCHLSDL